MSWLYSRVLVEEYLVDNCLDGEPSVPLSGSSTPQAYCAPDRMKDFSRISRFGMTFKPLTESRGEELLTLYLEASRAKTSAALEKELESRVNEAECGQSSQELLARYDPSTSLWRTAQCSLLEDLEQCLETFPKWGSMRNGACYQQPMLVQTTNERESGFWPTPRAQEPARTSVGYGRGLKELIEGKTQIQRWPTPTAHDAKDSGKAPSEGLRKSPCLAFKAGGKLNPTWVEWLMGWPLGWTDLKPLEMDKSLCVPQQPLNYLKRD